MKDYYDKVKAILEEHEETRDDDMKLYAWFVRRECSNVTKGSGFYQVLYHHAKYKLPSYESVTRARRKVQENEPLLCGQRRSRRKELEEEYRQYYSPYDN